MFFLQIIKDKIKKRIHIVLWNKPACYKCEYSVIITKLATLLSYIIPKTALLRWVIPYTIVKGKDPLESVPYMYDYISIRILDKYIELRNLNIFW